MLYNKNVLNVLLLISSLFGYLEWGQTNSEFIFQAEADIIIKIFTETSSIVHPLILIPLAGQILLIISLFQKEPSKLLTIIAISSIGILLLFMLLVGILAANFKIIISTLPFLILSFFTIRQHYRK
ncbi:MAG: hypothetical protein C0598_06010 [Marinilabiliales bacterium]|nr:MAG: hypothetical protein C0598_06010 [Marinilabiliales bacterium]